MDNPTKEEILSSSAYKHLPAVRREMQALAKKRDRIGAPFLKRKYRYLDGTWVLLHAMMGFNKIIMWGGGVYPHIVLTDHDGAWTYDWYKDSVASRSYPADYNGEGDIKPSFNGRSQIKDEAHLTYRGSWASAKIDDPHSFEYIGGLNGYEMTLFKDGVDIYGRVGEAFGQVAQLSDQTIMNAQYGSLYLFGVAYPVAWNQYSGLRGISFNPANRNINDSFYWIPAFFVAHPQDAYLLKPGFYYGQYPTCEYDIDNALESLTTTLKAVCNTKHTGYGEYLYGWAEYVSERNGLPEFDLYLFLQSSPLSVPSNPNQGHVRIAGTTADQFITVGWAGSGFDPTTKITLDASWVGFEMDMWNHGRWNDPASIVSVDQNGVSFVIFVGSKARAYRYTGILTLLMETEDYHSHSVSHDGSYLALFEGSGEITKVSVWDLFGTREAKLTGEGTYTQAAVTVLADQSEVVGVGSTTACLIPNREGVGTGEEYSPLVLEYDLNDFSGSAPLDDYGDYLPSMGVIHFGKRGTTPTFRKVSFEGLTARYGISVDDCFQSTIIIEDPDQGVKEEKLVGSWNAGGVIKGVVRGSFNGVHPNMRFAGVGTGDEITLNKNFSIIEYVDGTLGFEGYSGELSIGACIVHAGGEYRYDPLCTECGDPFTATASSSCGQTAERDVTPDPSVPITITFTDGPWIQVGDFAMASGGFGDYTYSITGGGAIDPETGEITSVGGCGTGQVIAEDSCGKTGSEDVAYPSGKWGAVYCVRESWYTKFCNSAWPGGTGPHDCHSPYEYPGVVRAQKEWVGATSGVACTNIYPCEAPWISKSAADAVAGTLTCGCDGGYTGNCCECYRLAFTNYWPWVCP
jgi:hypothetical protein